MNIFDVLNQGKGRLNEPNLSAMLGFLLLPTASHGLGDIFLRHFLNAVAINCGEETRFKNVQTKDAAVFLEQPYKSGMDTRIVDIEIRIVQKVETDDKDIEIHKIAIENKIKAQSAELEQFEKEFQYILHGLDDKETNITMVFLTPESKHGTLKKEYERLDSKILGNHKKAWLYWSDKQDSGDTITGLIKDILSKESKAEISPMTEYTRHTLKALVRHLVESLEKTPTLSPDWGIPELVFVEIQEDKYRIEKFKNSSVRVVNLETQKYEPVKPILEKIILEKDLGIDLYKADGSEKNSRVLGDKVMKELVRQEKNMNDI